MKQQNIKLLLTLLISMMGVKTLAHDFEVHYADGVTVFYYRFINNFTELEVSYRGSSYSSFSNEYTGNMVIPESVTYNGKTYSVTSIGNSAFYGCSGLKGVTIPNSVTSIGSSAFSGTGIYNNASDGIFYVDKWVCGYKGEQPSGSLILEEGSRGISGGAFYGCSGLTSVTIPNSVTSIGSSAFYGTGIYNNSSDGIFYVDKWVCGYKGNKSSGSLVIEEGSRGLSYGAFSGCSDLTSVTIPNSVTSIGGSAFEGCSSLTNVTIPNSVTSIGGSAFSGCSSLESVTIGAGVLSIGGSLFVGSSPAKVIWLTNTPPSGYGYAAGIINYVANDQYSFNSKTVYKFLSSTFEVDGVKYVPVSPSERTCDAIDCTYEPMEENLNIGETVEYKGVKMKVNQVHPYACYNNQHIKDVKICCLGDVGRYSFCGCKNIQTALLGEQVTGIGQYAFSDCSNLQSIVIPDAVKTVGKYAFQNCSSMESVKMGTGVETIETYTFTSCSALTDMQIGSNVKSINTYAFNNCSSLPLIEIPQSVTKIGNYVFRGCSALKDVYIADRTTELSLGSNGSSPLFADCPLDSVYIGGNISYNKSSNYGYSPFYRNTSLRSVHITDQETEISDNEFYGCTGLKNVRIGDGVTTIGNWAFSGCSSLEYFQFGSSVKTIGQEAFSDCVAVTKVISRASTPPTCGSQALDDLSKWECQLEVPEGMAAAYQKANQWKDFFFMEEGDAAVTWHKLIYEVDGEIFKTVNVAAGAAITPEQAPAKAGFTFAGWTGLPAKMPSHDVTVTARYVLAGTGDMSTRGDLNNDGFVNMADVTKLIDFILGRTQ